MPGGFLFTLKQIEKGDDKFAQWVHRLIDAGEDAKDVYEARWDKADAMYWREDGSSGIQLLDGVQSLPTALLTSRVDRVVKSGVDSIFSPSPWVSAIPDLPEQQMADHLETALQTVLEKVGIEKVLADAAWLTCLHAQSYLWARMDSDGMKSSVIGVRDFVMSPTYGAEIKDADLVGHKYYLPAWQIDERQNTGEWLPFKITVSKSKPEEAKAGVDSLDPMHTDVKLYNLIVRVPIKEGKVVEHKLMHLVYAYEEKKICFVEEYPYSRPWYSRLCFTKTYRDFYAEDGVARRLEGLQHRHTILTEMSICGTILTAMPPLVVSGGKIGAKLKKYGFGDIIETNAPIQAQTLQTQLNLEHLGFSINQVEQEADSVVGTTQTSVSQELAPNTTATAANLLAQTQQLNENSYTGHMADALEDHVAMMQEIIQTHSLDFERVYGSCISDNGLRAMAESVQFKVTGRSPDASPQIATSKAMALIELASNPKSAINYQEAEKIAVATLGIKVDTDALFQAPLPDPNQIPGQPGMSVPPGVMGGEAGGVVEPGVGLLPIPGDAVPFDGGAPF